MFNSSGEFNGKDSDKHIIIKRDNKRFKIAGTKETIDKHVDNIKKKCDVENIEVCYFFKKDTDFSKFITDDKKAYYNEAINVLEGLNDSLSDDQIESYYKELTTHLVKESKWLEV